MKQQQTHPDIYQLRIVLRGISPLIWHRLLVRSDTTLTHLHLILQILFHSPVTTSYTRFVGTHAEYDAIDVGTV